MVIGLDQHVSIIILNWNSSDILQTCLRTLRKNTEYEHYSTIVVDNASTDGSVDMLREQFKWVDVIENEENVGFSKGNNVGIRHALNRYDPEFVLLLNPDIEIIESGWLQELVDLGSKPDVGVVGCRLLFPDGEIQHASCRVTNSGSEVYTEDVYLDPTVLDRKEYVLGACFLIDRNLIDEIGLLDEGFTPINWEEADYCTRCREAGYDVVYTPDVSLIHHESKIKENQANTFLSYSHKKNRLRYALLNHEPRELFCQIPYEFRQLLGCFVRRKDRDQPLSLDNISRRRNPLMHLKIHLSAYIENVKRLPEIVSLRRNRTQHLP